MEWWRLRVRIHSSWRVALACFCFVVGVALSLFWRVPGWLGLAVTVPFVMVLYFPQVVLLPFVGILAGCIGVSYGSAHLVARDTYELYRNQVLTLEGRVKEDISRSASGNYSIQLESVMIRGSPMPGSVLVTSRSTNGALRGDRIVVNGQLREGFGSFPATISALKIVHVERTTTSDIGRVVRDSFAQKVRQVIPEPMASLGVGFLTGQKSALSDDLSNALKIAGLTHVVVASGYNLTILVRMARKLFKRVSKYISTLSASCMIIGFMFITGLSPSMTRAGLVSGMSLLSWYYGHAFHPFVLLPVAAAATVALQPSYVWGDLGWQLSFSAFLGVMIVGPLLQAYFFGIKEPGLLRGLLGETISAHIVTVPIIVLSFGVISNVAIIANLLVVPLVPLAMLLTFLCGMGVLVSIPFIEWLATPTTWLLQYMVTIATFVAGLPWAQSELAELPWVWVLYGLCVGAACWWMQRKTNYSFRAGEALL